MKTLKTANGQFGPFRSAVAMSDRYHCDGIDYFFSVVGAPGTSTIDEGTPDPIPVPPVVPAVIPMLNARTQLYLAGWLTPWEDLLAAMTGPDGDLARIKWATAQTVRRDDPLVLFAIAALNKTDAEADALFIAAAAIP
ncbi:hypothetical protein [Duganella violaceipulchra]|uniref:Uncharacterized protein n=1 Tax=Duganella violaceipulchra TaxID=2849652 RepID=A0AA41HDN3_9BURK|nr:hypothetical protein [Duganella violaceicalia]MBV6321893.1 hypothetical protein [Duganella violaceicalia]MCP2007113.1 hypothetical protein [Duganella violaceicalia]